MQIQYERLTDDDWEVIKQFLNSQRKHRLSLRDVLDALLWITRTGIQWRNLDDRFSPWTAVHYYFYKWSKDGTLKRIDLVLNAKEDNQLDRPPTPSPAIVDSQSIKL